MGLFHIASIVTKLITHGNFSPNYILKMFHCEIVFKCMQDVTTLTSSLQLIVECKGTWGQKNVLDSETHFHKWGRVQEIEPNDSQMHSHFGPFWGLYLCESSKYSKL